MFQLWVILLAILNNGYSLFIKYSWCIKSVPGAVLGTGDSSGQDTAPGCCPAIKSQLESRPREDKLLRGVCSSFRDRGILTET